MCCTSQSECWFNVDVLVRGRGSSTVGHKDRDGVVDQSVFGAARPEHRDVLGDGQQKGAERVVLGAARQPAVALLQREAYRREAVDRKDNQHPDGRVAAVEKQKKDRSDGYAALMSRSYRSASARPRCFLVSYSSKTLH